MATMNISLPNPMREWVEQTDNAVQTTAESLLLNPLLGVDRSGFRGRGTLKALSHKI